MVTVYATFKQPIGARLNLEILPPFEYGMTKLSSHAFIHISGEVEGEILIGNIHKAVDVNNLPNATKKVRDNYLLIEHIYKSLGDLVNNLEGLVLIKPYYGTCACGETGTIRLTKSANIEFEYKCDVCNGLIGK